MKKATRRRTQSKNGPRKRAGEAKRAPSRRIDSSPRGKLAIGIDRSRLMAGDPPIWVRASDGRLAAAGLGSLRLHGAVWLIWEVPADGRDPSVRVEVSGHLYELEDG